MYKHISKNNSNVNLNKFCENFYLPYEEPTIEKIVLNMFFNLTDFPSFLE